MTITHELIILPEAKLRKDESTPKYPGRRAVLLVSTTSAENSGEHRLKQRVFIGRRCVVKLESLVGPTRVHLTDNLDFIIASDELRSRGLGTLLLRRAVDFAHAKACSPSVLVRSIQLSEVDEKDPDNKERRDRCYSGVGFDLTTQPPSRKLHQPLSDFRKGLGAPAGVEAIPMADEAVYEPFLTQQGSSLVEEERAAKQAPHVLDGDAPKHGTYEPRLSSGSVPKAGAVVVVAFVLFGLWRLVS